MRHMYWLAPAVGAATMSAVMVTSELTSAQKVPQKDPTRTELKSITTLPISRVILFSSGVAHYARSAEVEGDARVDLTFPEQDINDLIKSMVLQDFSEKG